MTAAAEAPFDLLHGSTLVGVRRAVDDAWLDLDAPHIDDGGRLARVTVHLRAMRELSYFDRGAEGDAPDVIEPDAIIAAHLVIDDCRFEGGGLSVFGDSGRLRVCSDAHEVEIAIDGAPVALAELHRRVAAYWDAWRAALDLSTAHPLVREALVGSWSRAALPALLAAWRVERTSDLADVVEALDDATTPAPARCGPVAEPAELADWHARYTRAPCAALAQLVRCAFDTLDTLRADEPRDRAQLGAWLAARSARNESWWEALARAIRTLRADPPDPRIGRAMIAMLRSPSDHWFRVDQVAHVAGPFHAPHDHPSFADHALPAMREHGDAGSPRRLDDRAIQVSREADCNGAEMADRLRALAAELAARYPLDRALPRHARVALRFRT